MRVTILCATLASACTLGRGTISSSAGNNDAGAGGDAGSDSAGGGDASDVDPAISTCPTFGPDVYTPYRAAGRYPTGTVAQYAWHGPNMVYPNGDENFSAYVAGAPMVLECSDNKSTIPYFAVTDGCLDAVSRSGYMRGQIQPDAGYFRMVALGFPPGDTALPLKWTDTATEYRFYYSAQTDNIGNPGFKAFLRYRTEDDLYVASWRTDGVVQIQRKQCGNYTPLQILPNYGAPSTDTWHTIRFEAIGNELRLTLDGQVAIDTTDDVFASGTAGIRIDSMAGSYITDWKIFAPS